MTEKTARRKRASTTAAAATAPDGAPEELSAEWQDGFMADWRLEQAHIPSRFLAKSFETFKTSRKVKLKNIIQMAEAYVDAFNFKSAPPPGLILEGAVGSGKTHVAVGILKGVIVKGYSGLFYNMPDLLSDIRATYDQTLPLTEGELLEIVNKPDLLVLDDLGSEAARDWVNDRLYLIINRRYESNRPVLVTTNSTLEELEKKLGPRIVSRLCEMCEHFARFPEEDYRKKHMK